MRRASSMRPLLALLAAALPLLPLAARADDDAAVCNSAIAVAERQAAMPKRVMGTIALVESGRAVGKQIVPWPWSINVGGTGYTYPTKAAAIDAVCTFTAAGQRSIDVGCMQINLLAHPAAFDSLETAFEPAANAAYAARFLRTLIGQSGRVATAMTAYHSQTPEFANDYARRLLAVWPGAAELGLKADTRTETAEPATVSRISLDTRSGPALGARASVRAARVAGSGGTAGQSERVRLRSVRGQGWPG